MRTTILPLFMLCAGFSACVQADRSPAAVNPLQSRAGGPATREDSTEQVSTYIRCIFQDRDGDFWFGTTTDGVVRFTPGTKALSYFNARNGFGSDWVNAIEQDAKGELWFATRDGVVRYAPSASLGAGVFTRYTTRDGLPSDRIWSMLLDRDGEWWFGTYEGVSRFDGQRFSAFPIPAADLSAHPYYEDPKLIQAIVQDKEGAVWFATKGGAYRYGDGQLAHIGEPEGLCNDFVNTIHQGRDGRLLFGTRFGGACTYDGKELRPLLRGELKSADVGMLHEDDNGVLWIGQSAVGLCAYDGRGLTCYDAQAGPGIRVVFCMMEDDHGRSWLGTGAGLYRYEGGSFINMTKKELLRSGG